MFSLLEQGKDQLAGETLCREDRTTSVQRERGVRLRSPHGATGTRPAAPSHPGRCRLQC